MLKELLALQNTDLQIDRLVSKVEGMPEKKESADILAQINNIKEKEKEVTVKLKSLTLDQDKTEGELQMLEEKIKRETDKLYSGKVSNPKELSSLQEEIKMLNEKKDSIESILLEKMEEVGKIQEINDFYNQKIKALDDRLNEVLDVVESKGAEINKELDAVKISRQSQAEAIDKDLLEEYEDLRQKNQGVAIAELTEGACQACHMELPGVDVDKMKPGEKNYCPFCGRLVKY